MIQNAIYRWFAELFAEHFHEQQDLVFRMQMGELVGGISLDCLYIEDPQFALRLRDAIVSIAEEIAAGTHTLTDDLGLPRLEMQEKCERAFAELVSLLRGWNP